MSSRYEAGPHHHVTKQERLHGALDTEITENGRGGTKTVCLCRHEDSARIIKALDFLYEYEAFKEGGPNAVLNEVG